uniref:nuclear pore complex protein NUP93A-like isoform X2 n=1 Tax=Fragaria vesca subsp. vesca TaxID=101020 RepID=UPI0005CB2E25|nr:PREDICTED: nuclear pore complex protein NUP93A-like isoform X2 [Fragaria vesca subsp. vesca]
MLHSTEMSLVLGAKRFLEWRHSKYMMGRISEYPVLVLNLCLFVCFRYSTYITAIVIRGLLLTSLQAALGGEVVNMQQIRAFLRVHLKDYGLLDFDASDVSNPPPVDTTWQQIYFCLRSGYNDEARTVAASSNASQEFAPPLNEWITSGGRVSPETSARASYELDMMLRTYDVEGGAGYEKEKMLVYALVSGSRSLFHRLREDYSPLFDTDEHYHWFMLASIRDIPVGAASTVTHAGLETLTLSDLQVYVNTSGPDEADRLMYPYLLLLSIQLIPAITYMFEEYDIDAAHVSIALADHGVLSEVAGAAQGIGMMDAYGKASHITKQYGSTRFLPHDISMALEYYAQAAAVLGGGRLAWPIGGNVGQQRQRNARLKHVLSELLMTDGGIRLLFGFRGKEGELARFFPDVNERIQFLHEAARQCQEFGLPGKCREIKAEIRRG